VIVSLIVCLSTFSRTDVLFRPLQLPKPVQLLLISPLLGFALVTEELILLEIRTVNGDYLNRIIRFVPLTRKRGACT